MKRILLAIACLLLVLSLSFAGFSAPAFKVAMVTDIGGLGDKSFNDAAYDGLKRLEKELGCEIKVVESQKMEDYVPNLKSLADQKFDMIWAIGFLMADAMNEVSKMYPDQKFGIIDSVVNQPNVHSVTFKEQEGSFLVGVIAATDTKKAKVGFLGGMEFPLIKKFEAGYMAGVKVINPKCKIFSSYTGSFTDAAKGKEMTAAQFTYGADIVYHASGACGIGAIAAAKEKGKGYWVIGVDKCQHEEGINNGKDSVLACMTKRVDVGVFRATKLAIDGKSNGGITEMGLIEEGVGVCATAKRTASKKALANVEKYRKMIIDGKIVVPIDPKEVK